MSFHVPDVLVLLAAIPFISIGMYTDLRARRISNRLNGAMLLAGLLVHLAFSGTRGLLYAALGAAIGLAVLLPFYAMGAIGAGDVKFLAALGAWLQPWGCLYALAAGIVAAGLTAAVRVVRRGEHAVFTANLALIARKISSGRVFDPEVAGHAVLNRQRGSMACGAYLGLGGIGVLALRAAGLEI